MKNNLDERELEMIQHLRLRLHSPPLELILATRSLLELLQRVLLVVSLIALAAVLVVLGVKEVKDALVFQKSWADVMVKVIGISWIGVVASVILYFISRWRGYRREAARMFELADEMMMKIRKSERELRREQSVRD
jgi:hypothetical protein